MKLSSLDLKSRKNIEKIAMLTAYTTPVAKCLEAAGIPVILVGDTVGMVEMGFGSTQSVTIDHMKYHVSAVRRGAPHTHIIGDMPYKSDTDQETALDSAKQLLDAGADSVKLEGPKYEIIEYLVSHEIPVVGHTGLTPQTAQNFKQVGKNEQEASRILTESQGIANAGAFMIVLEHIPSELGDNVTRQISIPTIGIGAGPGCDGQVLVINDMIGLDDTWPPFSKQYAHVSDIIHKAASQYKDEVERNSFP